MALGKKKEGLYLRPRVRRTTPLLDVAMAVLAGGVSGIYIFNDTFQRWQQAELALEQDQSAGKPVIPGNDQQSAPDNA